MNAETIIGNENSALAPPNVGSALSIWNGGRERRGNPQQLRGLVAQVETAFSEPRTDEHQKKEVIARLIADFLLSKRRLLADMTDQGQPQTYLIADDGSAIEIEADNHLLRLSLQDTGLNPSESAFRYTVEDLNHRATREGQQVKVERYAVYKNGKLYVSSGTRDIVIVRVEGGETVLEVHGNGYDGVLFAANACFATWQPTDRRDFETLDCFRPNLSPPSEAPSYTASTQRSLLRIWMVGIVARITLPILSCIGSKGSGKSVLVRAIIKLLLGEGPDISSQPDTPRDFFAASTGWPVYGIDNLDCNPPRWFSDAIAAACTGVNQTSRQLYTNATPFTKPVTSAFAVTTRTALFASRSDVTERVLPLFYGELDENQKRDDRELLQEVVSRRDALMTGLVLEAFDCLSNDGGQVGLPGRFQGFARLVEARYPEGGREMLRAYEEAQLLSIVDPDPLLDAIIKFVKEHGELQGFPKEIYETVNADYQVPNQGGGKAIAGKLREMKSALRLAGVVMREDRVQQKARFTIYQEKNPAITESAESPAL